MFEEYLQDSYEFLSIASTFAQKASDREARRYYRGAVFYASGAIEAFINYVADSFAKAGSLSAHEICFLNDKTLTFSVDKGLQERVKYNTLEDKIRLLVRKFVSEFDFRSSTWSKFIEFKSFRDGLVHPRRAEDDTPLSVYDRKVRDGLKAVIEIMSQVSLDVFGKPLRKQLLDLIPD
jgi:hypothetical protein